MELSEETRKEISGVLRSTQKKWLQDIVSILSKECGIAVLEYKYGYEQLENGKFRSTGIAELKIAMNYMID